MDDIVDFRPFVPWNPVEEAARVLAATRTATVAARGAMAALASATKDAADPNPDYGGADCQHGCGRPEHYSIALAIYDPDIEQVVAWQCPDCGKRWER